jgi:hydrogenase expression/formation protein HypC
MCLAIPGKVEKINDLKRDEFQMGTILFGNIRKEVNLCMVPEVKLGDYVLVHVGVAIAIVDEEEALKTFEYVAKMGELDEINESQEP